MKKKEDEKKKKEEDEKKEEKEDEKKKRQSLSMLQIRFAISYAIVIHNLSPNPLFATHQCKQ